MFYLHISDRPHPVGARNQLAPKIPTDPRNPTHPVGRKIFQYLQNQHILQVGKYFNIYKTNTSRRLENISIFTKPTHPVGRKIFQYLQNQHILQVGKYFNIYKTNTSRRLENIFILINSPRKNVV